MIFRSAFEYYPSGISTILCHCTTSYEYLLVRYFSSILPFHRFWVVVNQEHQLPLFHHSFCLLSSLIDGILFETSRQMCRNQRQHFGAFQVSINLVVRNTILTPRWFVLSSMASFDSLPVQTWSCTSCSVFPWWDIHMILGYHHIFPFHWSV